eukprot:COSAG05_NODE_29_length_29038_cov_1237.466985_12_plen_206_part_00
MVVGLAALLLLATACAEMSAEEVANKAQGLRDASEGGDTHLVRKIIQAATRAGTAGSPAVRAVVLDADTDGLTPLIHAARGGHAEAVQLLLEAGAGAGVDHHANDGATALMGGAVHNSPVITKALIEAGASLDVQRDGGQTALMIACSRGNADVVALLLEKGAAAGLRDDTGKNALSWAEVDDHVDIAKMVMNKMAWAHHSPDEA